MRNVKNQRVSNTRNVVKNTQKSNTSPKAKASAKGKSSIRSKSISKKKKQKHTFSFLDFLKSERTIQVLGILLMCFSILLFISIFSAYFYYNNDHLHIINNETEPQNFLGSMGAHLAFFFIKYTFGIFAIGFPFLFFLYASKLTFKKSLLPLMATSITTFVSMAWLSVTLAAVLQGNHYDHAGEFGNYLATILLETTKGWGTALILLFVLFLILILFYNVSPVKVYDKASKINLPRIPWYQLKKVKFSAKEKKIKVKEPVIELPVNAEMEDLYTCTHNIFTNDINKHADELADKKSPISVEADSLTVNNEGDNYTFNIVNEEETKELPVDDELPVEEVKTELVETTQNDEVQLEPYDPRADLSLYQFPPIDLMDDYGANDGVKHMDRKELNENSEKIRRTLENFGIKIKQISATIGPTVTLYEIVPDDGVRISKIKNLEDDIALSLAALGIRIIAPIPGKGTIGIEVPNKKPQIVAMREVIESEKFQNNSYDLPIGLGKTISNAVFVVDLAKMPHLLMAGATGQGKSVGLNAIIASLLYKKHPAELKFVLVDPKKVEFSLFSTIENHYLAKLPDTEDPVITDTKKVVQTLNSLCKEMDMRYDLLKIAKAKNIKEYNAKFCARKLSPALGHRYLPYIVLIIDEFGDLIMTAGREIEVPIARLAQLARAIGIHLIIATQRPSVNIITGTIKANFPTRLAFRVSSKIDSRTILDSSGADQLIGRGDLLLSTGSDLIRLQCAFIDTPEVERIANFIEEQQGYFEAFMLPEFVIEDKKGGGMDDDLGDSSEIDPMFMEAARIVVQGQLGSTSQIQRKLKLGYNRAGRIMDQLEEFQIVGPSAGSKAREVKVKTLEELNGVFMRMGLI